MAVFLDQIVSFNVVYVLARGYRSIAELTSDLSCMGLTKIAEKFSKEINKCIFLSYSILFFSCLHPSYTMCDF